MDTDEIFNKTQPNEDVVEKPKKQKKPMDENKRAKMLENLKKGRESRLKKLADRKGNKSEATEQPPKPVPQPVTQPVPQPQQEETEIDLLRKELKGLKDENEKKELRKQIKELKQQEKVDLETPQPPPQATQHPIKPPPSKPIDIPKQKRVKSVFAFAKW